MPLIDVHAHTEFSLEKLIRIHSSFTDSRLTKEELLEDVENLGIEYMFSIGKKDGMLRSFSSGEITDGVDTLKKELKQYPFLKRIIAVSLQNEGNLNQIEKYSRNELVSGIKVYYGYSITDPNSEELKPYYDLASEFGLPLFFHVGWCFPNIKEIAHPSKIEPVLEQYPNTQFVLCHLGYPKVEDTADIVSKYGNAFADISGLVSNQSIKNGRYKQDLKKVKPVITELLESDVGNKLMFGSDYPIVPIEVYFNLLKEIIPQEHHDNVFYWNAKNFFKL